MSDLAMRITRKHTLWIVILAILAGIVLFMMRAKVAGATPTSATVHGLKTQTGCSTYFFFVPFGFLLSGFNS